MPDNEIDEKSQKDAMSSLRAGYGQYRPEDPTNNRTQRNRYWVAWLVASPLFPFLILNWWASFDRFMSGGYDSIYGFSSLPPIFPTLYILALIIVVHIIGKRIAK